MISVQFKPQDVVMDSDQLPMQIGQKYEMYTPAAEQLYVDTGLSFEGREGSYFTYTGVAHIEDRRIVCGTGAYHDPRIIGGHNVKIMNNIADKLGGNYPICDVALALVVVRQVRDE